MTHIDTPAIRAAAADALADPNNHEKWDRFRNAVKPVQVTALLDQLDAAKARVAKLEEGLKPFAKVGRIRSSPNMKAVWGFDGPTVTDGDFRRARALLNERTE